MTGEDVAWEDGIDGVISVTVPRLRIHSAVVFEGGLSAIASDYDSSATASAKADPDDPRRTKRSSRIANSNADSWYLLSTICYSRLALAGCSQANRCSMNKTMIAPMIDRISPAG
jgi:hypothetical protein